MIARYTGPDLGRIWSDQRKYETWLQVELAAVDAMARAEALIGSCKVGFMERPERIVLVILGALCDTWGVMAPALWVLAALSTVTVIHRIRFTYTETERRKLVPAR